MHGLEISTLKGIPASKNIHHAILTILLQVPSSKVSLEDMHGSKVKQKLRMHLYIIFLHTYSDFDIFRLTQAIALISVWVVKTPTVAIHTP